MVFQALKLTTLPEYLPDVSQSYLLKNEKIMNRIMYDGFLPEITALLELNYTEMNIILLMLDYFKTDMFGLPIVSYDNDLCDTTINQFSNIELYN